MGVDFPDHPFWDFSIQVYGRGGIPEACLELQEAHGVDINVVLYCCWLGQTGRGRLDASEITTICAAVGQWHEIAVRGVRTVRQRLKGGMAPAPIELSEPLRQRLATIEVQLEHIEQLILAGTVDRAPDEARTDGDRLTDAVANTRGYFEAFGASATTQDVASFAVILGSAFAHRSAAAVEDAANILQSA